MRTFRPPVAPLALLLLGSACGGDTGGPSQNTLPTPSVACAAVAVTQLAVGEHAVVNPGSSTGCLRLPQAGPAGAQYLLVLAATLGSSSPGIEGPYLLRASNPGAVVVSPPAVAAVQARVAPSRSAAREFDATLRRREAELVAATGARIAPMTVSPVAAPPVVGEVKAFKTCSNLTCTAFTTVQATARYVGTHAVVYIDNAVPQNDPLQDADFDELGTAFDTHHYPIDTTAFGRESDIDGNGLVAILMTDAVNDLTPDCTDGRVIGYFFGGDLTNNANSNHGEVFYTLVPAPKVGTCNAITRRMAVDNLKPTLIHEFQHMISFNQHTMVRSGNAEIVWLNEAMSHFAEELGGRLIPNAECAPTFTSCRSQYTSGDIFNSYDYLKDAENHFVIFSGSGGLEERGASWAFLRWTLDQFAIDTILGTDLPEEPTGRLRYKSWGLRGIWTDPRNAQFFPAGFPLVPETIGGSFTHSGVLKAGSGRHFLVVQGSIGAALDLQVLKSTAGAPLDPALQGRFGIVRIH